jgi:hypothetical protein
VSDFAEHKLMTNAGDTERKTFAYRVNGRMTAPFPPDVESSHGEFSRAPTNRAVTAATLLGHMVFVIVVRSAGSYIRSAKVPATACLKKETLRMALRDIDHRHLCWTTFEAVVGQELQRQPLNGLIWQNETLMLSELCWRARVLEMQRAGHSEIQFELRIQVASELHCMFQPRTHALTMRRGVYTILDRKREAKAQSGQSRLHVEDEVR